MSQETIYAAARYESGVSGSIHTVHHDVMNGETIYSEIPALPHYITLPDGRVYRVKLELVRFNDSK